MMKQPVVIVGIGELGGVFARGFLRIGHPVYPITRGTDLTEEARMIPEPTLVLIAVGEPDLHPVLKAIPAGWKDRVALLQNELLPRDWEVHDLSDPTVIVVWFEKKKGMEVKRSVPSPVYGPKAALIESALNALDIQTRRVNTQEEILHELLHKNLHILTMNITGLVTGGTLGDLVEQHQDLTREVAGELVEVQDWLTEIQLPREALVEKTLKGFASFPDQPSMGRSAPARLARVIRIADQADLAVPRLRAIQASLNL
jgi:ketopantoate reductase